MMAHASEPLCGSARRLLMPTRGYMLLHLFFSFVICNLDRVNVAVAIVPMGDALHWSSTTRGVVQSSFFVGYLLTQIPGGRVADSFGGRRVLATAVAAWSALTALTPPAARLSFHALLLARVLLGLAEGFAMPSVNAAVATWIPAQETARALSFVYSGMYAGSILGLLASPALLEAYGWPALFYVFGITGIAWSMLFTLTTADSPAVSKNITDGERAFIMEHAPKSRGGYEQLPTIAKTPNTSTIEGCAPTPTLRDIFSRRCVWAIIVAHYCCTWGYFVLLTWLPSYLHMQFALDISKSSLLAIAPWVTMFVAANISGYFADMLLAHGHNKTRVRKLMQSVAFVGSAFFLMLLARASTPGNAVLLVSLALAFASCSNSGVYSNHQDIGPQCAGTLLGVSNTFASIPGIVGVSVTGVILDKTNNDWAAVFHLAIAFNALGFIVYNLFASAERQWG